ncbi:MAG: hypothetical protein KF774_18000 [Planctomyces sp.]|nr:hypothetical protein [Planctomyces sp.]
MDRNTSIAPPLTVDSGRAAVQVGRRLNRAFGPIAAGMIIDSIDLLTLGPIGLYAGPAIGGLAGFWLGRCLRLSGRESLLCGVIAAIYCSIPFTEVMPLGTIAGAWARFREISADDAAREQSDLTAAESSSGDANTGPPVLALGEETAAAS